LSRYSSRRLLLMLLLTLLLPRCGHTAAQIACCRAHSWRLQAQQQWLLLLLCRCLVTVQFQGWVMPLQDRTPTAKGHKQMRQ
jgi:hypothetical protein